MFTLEGFACQREPEQERRGCDNAIDDGSLSARATRTVRAKSVWRKWLLQIAKAGISVALLWWISRKLNVGAAMGKLLTLSSMSILLGLVLTFCSALVAILRWDLITRKIGISIASSTIIRYGLIAYFLNQALPSSFGGDGVRGWLLYRDGIGASSAVSSIFLDRLAGVVFLLILSLYGLSNFLRQTFDLNPLFLVAGLAGVVLLGAAVVTVITKEQSRLNRYRAGRLLVQIIGNLKLLARMNRTLVNIAVLSLTAQLLSCSVVWVLLRGLNDNVSLIDVLTVTPVIFFLLIVPISIAGWGLREGLFVAGLGLIGVNQEAALVSSLAFGLMNLFASLIGGLLWILDAGAAQGDHAS